VLVCLSSANAVSLGVGESVWSANGSRCSGNLIKTLTIYEMPTDNISYWSSFKIQICNIELKAYAFKMIIQKYVSVLCKYVCVCERERERSYEKCVWKTPKQETMLSSILDMPAYPKSISKLEAWTDPTQIVQQMTPQYFTWG